MNYIKGLNAIRAFAVFFVLVWHFIPRHSLNTLLGVLEQLLLPSGAFGVILFFVLSGFLITRLLLIAKESCDNKMQIIKNFIIRRALRIFPIYYILLGVLYLFKFNFSEGELPYLFSYTSNIFMFMNNMWSSLGHTWSLSIEEQFYLIWPWIIIFTPNRYLIYVLLFFVFVGMLSSYLVARTYGVYFDSPINLLTTSCFDAFGIGGVLAYLQLKNYNAQLLRNFTFILFLLAICISLYWKLCPLIQLHPHYLFFYRTISSILSFCVIYYVITLKKGYLQSFIFENSLLNTIGKISYGIYLYHYPLSQPINDIIEKLHIDFLLNAYIVFIVKSIIVILISYFSFEILEKRILKLKDKFEYEN